MKIIKHFLVLTALVLVTACVATEEPIKTAQASTSEHVGTVKYVVGEAGSFFGIETHEGERYVPKRLPADFENNGLQVRFKSRQVANAASGPSWGELVDLVDIESYWPDRQLQDESESF